MIKTLERGHYQAYNTALQTYMRGKIKEMLASPKFKGQSQRRICADIGIDSAWFRRCVKPSKPSASLNSLVWIACQLGVEFDLEVPHYRFLKEGK